MPFVIGGGAGEVVVELVRESPHMVKALAEFGVAGALVWGIWAVIAGLLSED
jgi:hypothetical protein